MNKPYSNHDCNSMPRELIGIIKIHSDRYAWHMVLVEMDKEGLYVSLSCTVEYCPFCGEKLDE